MYIVTGEIARGGVRPGEGRDLDPRVHTLHRSPGLRWGGQSEGADASSGSRSAPGRGMGRSAVCWTCPVKHGVWTGPRIGRIRPIGGRGRGRRRSGLIPTLPPREEYGTNAGRLRRGGAFEERDGVNPAPPLRPQAEHGSAPEPLAARFAIGYRLGTTERFQRFLDGQEHGRFNFRQRAATPDRDGDRGH